MSNDRTRILTGLFLLAGCSASATAGNLYISDDSFFTVRVFDATTGTLTGTLTPAGGWGSPTGIAVGPDGNVYVADAYDNVVDRFSSSGAFLGTFVSSGLDSPSGLAFGPDGNLYVASSSYIARFDSSGNPVDGSPFVPSSTGLQYPGAIAFGPDGNLYIADSNGTVDKVIRTTGAFSTLVLAGCPSTPFSNPQGVAFGPDQNLYVSDEGYGCYDPSLAGGSASFGVYKYDTSGNLLGTFVAPNVLDAPIDLAFGPDGNLYVTDSQARVARFNGTTGAEMADFVANGGSSGPLTIPTFLAFSEPSVPEPATLGMMGLGLAGLVLRRLRRPRAS
jgi:DNA-binding beta-propeller fold protein YncE